MLVDPVHREGGKGSAARARARRERTPAALRPRVPPLGKGSARPAPRRHPRAREEAAPTDSPPLLPRPSPGPRAPAGQGRGAGVPATATRKGRARRCRSRPAPPRQGRRDDGTTNPCVEG